MVFRPSTAHGMKIGSSLPARHHSNPDYHAQSGEVEIWFAHHAKIGTGGCIGGKDGINSVLEEKKGGREEPRAVLWIHPSYPSIKPSMAFSHPQASSLQADQ